MLSASPKLPTLRETIGQTFVIAYREDTTVLESVLRQERLTYEILRQQEGEIPSDFARSYACLLNHCKAWRRVISSGQCALILEADFVPVRGMVDLPTLCDIKDDRTGIAWLYTCASQLYYVTTEGFAEGFSVSTVAYMVTPNAAIALLELAEQIRLEYGERSYSPWDSKAEVFLRSRSLLSYIPFRNYGEHGGIPNPEHIQNRDRWKQISRCHRADRLYGKLAFLPAYASNDWEFWQVRSYAWVKGLGRLLLGKFLRWKVVRNSSVPFRLIEFAIKRQGI